MNGTDVSDLIQEYKVIHKAGELPILRVKFNAINLSVNGAMIPELPEPWKGSYVLKEPDGVIELKTPDESGAGQD